MRKLVLALCAGVLALGTMGGTAMSVTEHRHCMLTPNGYVELAEGALRNKHDPAFHNFHNHVHFGENVPTHIVGLLDLNLECSSLDTP